MIYLCLAIVCTALVSIAMRFGDGKIQNNMAMFVTNYAICAALSCAFLQGGESLAGEIAPGRTPGFFGALGMGLAGGILFLGSFILLQKNIRENGVVLSAAFMKMGVLIPTLMAIFLFGQRPGAPQILGILLAVAAILMIHLEKDGVAARRKLLLPVLLIGGGLSDGILEVFEELGNPLWKDWFLLFIFAAAGILALALWLAKQRRVCPADIIFGVAIGVPNYFSARFLLLALPYVPAVVAYPAFSIAGMGLITLAGVAFFKETLSRRKIGAIGIICIALVLLNL